MADGRAGGTPVSAGPGRGVPRHVAALFLLVVVAASACAVLGAMAWQEVQDRSEAVERGERHGAVIDAATAQATAFINIDHRSAEEDYEEVRRHATGDFKEQYDTSQESVTRVLKQNESVMEGEVLWAGVSTLDGDSATVLVATTGTVANTQTDGEPVDRNFRLRLDLERVDGSWRTSDLSFVG